MPGPQGERCSECYYWVEIKFKLPESKVTNGWGTCRRYPITAIAKEGTGTDEALRKGNGAFPRIRGVGWCGEWKSLVTDTIINEVRTWAKQTNVELNPKPLVEVEE